MNKQTDYPLKQLESKNLATEGRIKVKGEIDQLESRKIMNEWLFGE